MSVPVGKSRGLLSDQNIAAWYSNLCEGSEITADVYLRRLGRFCEENDQTPQSLAGMDAKTAFNVLVTAVRRYREQGFAGSMIKGYVKAVRSWLLHNDVEIKRVNVKGANKTPTLRNEKTPEPYVLNRFGGSATNARRRESAFWVSRDSDLKYWGATKETMVYSLVTSLSWRLTIRRRSWSSRRFRCVSSSEKSEARQEGATRDSSAKKAANA